MQDASSQTPFSFAWRWFCWIVLAATVAALAPRASRLFELNTLAVWVLLVVLWGGLAFVLGYGYGCFKLRGRTRQ